MYMWSDPKTWELTEDYNTFTGAGRLLPAAGDRVTIPRGMLIRLDVSTPVLEYLEVTGALDFAEPITTSDSNYTDNPTPIILRAKNILVYGRLSVNGSNTAGAPYRGKAEIVLHGDSSDPGFELSGVNYAPKALVVLGQLLLNGEVRNATSRWMQLTETAAKGQRTATILEGAGWLRANDSVVLAPTGYDTAECDELTVESVVDINCTKVDGNPCDQIVTFVQELQYDHAVQSAGGGEPLTMRGEILLLSSNVVIRGDNNSATDKFGAHILVPKHNLWDPVRQEVVTSDPTAQFSDVEIRHAGHAPNASLSLAGRHALKFENLLPTYCFVRRCSIHSTYGVAVGVSNTQTMILQDNAVYNSPGFGFHISSNKNWVMRNIVSRLTAVEIDPYSADPWAEWSACYDIHPDNFVLGNVAAGSERIGFKIPGAPCKDSTARGSSRDVDREALKVYCKQHC